MAMCVIDVHFVGPNVYKLKWKKGISTAQPKGPAHVNKPIPKIPAKAEEWTRQPASFLFILDQGPAGDLHKRQPNL